VDLAEEFTDMIIVQQAFAASGRVITTGDEMLDEVIRLKR
jgi:flagellar hook protein FlgE